MVCVAGICVSNVGRLCHRVPSRDAAEVYFSGRPLVPLGLAAPAAVSLLVCMSSPMYLGSVREGRS